MEKFHGFGGETQEQMERRISSVKIEDGGEIKVGDFTFEVFRRELGNHRFILSIYNNYEPEGFMDDLKFAFSSRLVLQEKLKAYFKYNHVDECSSLIVFDNKTGVELQYSDLTNDLNEKELMNMSESIWKALEVVLKSQGEDLSDFVNEVI